MTASRHRGLAARLRRDGGPPRDLGRRLRGTPVPDTVPARERGWRLVEAAYAERDAAPARRAGPRVAVVAAVVAAGLAVGLTPAGAAIGHWVRDVVAPTPVRRFVRMTLGPLPGRGRLLALAPSGAWVVQGDGTRRRLGPYAAAAWSPRGLYVAVARGRLLAAVDPRGRVRWTLTRPARVTRPAWSPDGCRVAYRSGRELRVVYGDGARDRALAVRTAPVTPAWQPTAPCAATVAASGGATTTGAGAGGTTTAAGARAASAGATTTGAGAGGTTTAAGARAASAGATTTGAGAASGGSGAAGVAHRLAAVDGRGRVVFYDTDTGRVLWRARAGGRVAQLAWSPSGARLLVVTAAGVRVLDARGHTRRVMSVAGAREVAWLPRGRFLLLRSGELTLEPSGRRLLVLPGGLTDLVVSPDRRRALVAEPLTRQWLLLDLRRGRLTAFDGVGRQFDPAGRGPAALPRPLAWIR